MRGRRMLTATERAFALCRVAAKHWRALALALAGLAGLALPAAAQGTIRQMDVVTNGHLGMFVANGQMRDAGGPTVANGKPANSTLAGRLPSGLGIVNSGLGYCQWTGYASAGYSEFCWGFDGSGNALISVSRQNGGAAPGFSFNINGALYGFPGPGNGNVMGPSPNPAAGNVAEWNGGLTLKDSGVAAARIVTGPTPTTVGDIALFNNTTGTLLKGGTGNIGTIAGFTITGLNTAREENGIVQLNGTHQAGQAYVVPGMGVFMTSVADNSGIKGAYGIFIRVDDDASVAGNPALRGKLSGLQANVKVLAARNNSPADDVTGVAINNVGTANGSEGLYIGQNVVGGDCSGVVNCDFNTGVGVDANAYYGIALAGSYGIGIDLARAASFSASAIRMKEETAIVFTPTPGGTEYSLISSDSSHNVRLGQNAQQQIAQGTFVVPNMPTTCSGNPVGTLWNSSGDVRLC